MEYNFYADLLNKYSQLTPVIQGILGISFFGMILGIFYFLKESIALIIKPFVKLECYETKKENKEWKDRYYRGE